MKKNEIKKAHEKAVERELPKAIRDHARYEAHSRVSEAVREERPEERASAPMGHGERENHSTETGRRTGTTHVSPHDPRLTGGQ